jgi:hypothetical protein
MDADSLVRYYSQQANGSQVGGGGVNIAGYHRGPQFQRGYGLGGIFASLFRRFLPVLTKTALPLIKSTAQDAGKALLQAGLNTAAVGLQGGDIKEAARTQFTEAGKGIGTRTIEAVRKQIGGRKRKRTRSLSQLRMGPPSPTKQLGFVPQQVYKKQKTSNPSKSLAVRSSPKPVMVYRSK